YGIPRPKRREGERDTSLLGDISLELGRFRTGYSPQKSKDSWEESSPSKSESPQGESSSQGLSSPQGSESYREESSPPRSEVDREKSSPIRPEGHGEESSPPKPKDDRNRDSNTPRKGDSIYRVESSTPRADYEGESSPLRPGGNEKKSDFPKIRCSKEDSDIIIQEEKENNSQRLNIVIQIDDKRDTREIEENEERSPGQAERRQRLLQTQRERRLDCVNHARRLAEDDWAGTGSEDEEPKQRKRKEKRKNRIDTGAQEEDPEEGTSHLHYTRSVARKEARERIEGSHTIAPLRQIMPIAGDQGRVKVPFTTSDLNSWREEARNFRKNPEGVAKRFELIAKNLDIDWSDIEVMLSELTETEKELVLKTGRDHASMLPEELEIVFPSRNPEWDPNNPDSYGKLVQYRKLIAL
ncbi:uncharacterized protein LOC113996043, partial [Pipra filicauda]|uniref:Uncharacterized protein LOC113996043 n=1 Tax=Pipra filicauda TaxID=649802 RepID=A0A7R5K1P2_9PASS